MVSAPDPSFALILAAGGRGVRFGGGEQPKQFIELQGLPLYMWSLKVFLASARVRRAVIVAPSDMVAPLQEQLPAYDRYLSGKEVKVVSGGQTRQASVREGLLALADEPPDYVLVHDAARPFVTGEVVERVIEGAIKHGACTTAISPADTVKTVSGDHVAKTLDRDSLVLVQTPQSARFDWLIAAHEKAAEEMFAATDDASVLEYAEHHVGIVGGAASNVKLTCPDDLILAKALASIVLTDRL